jgi:hypothetical protein
LAGEKGGAFHGFGLAACPGTVHLKAWRTSGAGLGGRRPL